jgi:hypothetical protein
MPRHHCPKVGGARALHPLADTVSDNLLQWAGRYLRKGDSGMSNRKLLLKAREKAGIKSSTQTLREDMLLFKYTIPNDFLTMDKQDFWRHFNKLHQTNYVLTCLYVDQLAKENMLRDYQVEIIRDYFPEFNT